MNEKAAPSWAAFLRSLFASAFALVFASAIPLAGDSLALRKGVLQTPQMPARKGSHAML
jgi:hypothetical protein